MRRLLFIATFLLSFTPAFLLAQHGGGGGHAGGGHAMGASRSGGVSGHGFSGHSVSVHSGSGFRSHSTLRSPAFRGRVSTAPNFFRPNSPGLNRFRGPRIRNFRNCIGCRFPFYGYGGYGYYDPWWWWDSDSSYDDDQARQMEMANEMNQQSLEEQQMRQQGEQYDQDAYGRPTPLAPRDDAPRNQAISAATPAIATVLVFRDQHQQQVQNYAIVGETLWAFEPQRTQKIPLSDLDIPATQKANDDRGVEFKVPGGEGQ
jgi:hypothetical protein